MGNRGRARTVTQALRARRRAQGCCVYCGAPKGQTFTGVKMQAVAQAGRIEQTARDVLDEVEAAVARLKQRPQEGS